MMQLVLAGAAGASLTPVCQPPQQDTTHAKSKPSTKQATASNQNTDEENMLYERSRKLAFYEIFIIAKTMQHREDKLLVYKLGRKDYQGLLPPINVIHGKSRTSKIYYAGDTPLG